ncbi:hypothetical protein NNJEOMEG_01748 [Fundidesulfovibrio magnetotacticus]|uniref:Acyltransferase 3 domain-containing protein n=1 Tax=Fundidesulfovibrio magnetotacticus TaxID=2730080 RepID=A0A6V8LSG6_9BACT|nr:acyltransferase [Fundidesulfovibrio magnetotacticus]GFK93910.1 hypothetical protein NNJEOMEG_01748 [Fundidesulfovibrio magnetotacticus]
MSGPSSTSAPQNVAIHVLRSLAILLIVNSHMTPLYPDGRFAVGGHLGNSIFFFASGFGLLLSYINRPLAPIDWYRRRFLRLFVPAILFFIIANPANPQKLLYDIWQNMIPHSLEQSTRFLPNLIVLYLLFPLVVGRNSFRLALLAIALIAPAALVLGSNNYSLATNPSSDILYCFNALCMFLFGIIAGQHYSSSRNEGKSIPWLTIFITSMTLHTAIVHFIPSVRMINFYVNISTMTSLFFVAGRINDMSIFTRNAKFFAYIASLSLAVYILHFELIKPTLQYIGKSFATVPLFMAASIIVAIPATLLSKKFMHISRI